MHVRPANVFVMVEEMDQVMRYSLAIWYLDLAYEVLREFQYKFGTASRTYGPWALV